MIFAKSGFAFDTARALTYKLNNLNTLQKSFASVSIRGIFFARRSPYEATFSRIRI